MTFEEIENIHNLILILAYIDHIAEIAKGTKKSKIKKAFSRKEIISSSKRILGLTCDQLKILAEHINKCMDCEKIYKNIRKILFGKNLTTEEQMQKIIFEKIAGESQGKSPRFQQFIEECSKEKPNRTEQEKKLQKYAILEEEENIIRSSQEAWKIFKKHLLV